LGALLEQYGTYEMNGVAFSDASEIWWLETVGGHHWIAKRVPDEAYVTMPNQLGIDEFDLDDALGDQEDHMCSADLAEFIEANHLDLSVESTTPFNPRDAFGSHSDSDHVYNTPRAWFMQRFLNPYDEVWDGPDADHSPESDDIPWARQPDRKITIEDVKYVLSSHYQGTPYDPYGKLGDEHTRHMFRTIGINRQSQLAVIQIRPYQPQANRAIQWMAYGSNPFNALVPFYANVDTTPDYSGRHHDARDHGELLLGEPRHRGAVQLGLRRDLERDRAVPGGNRRHGPLHGGRHRRPSGQTGRCRCRGD
jgi:dipeptidase